MYNGKHGFPPTHEKDDELTPIVTGLESCQRTDSQGTTIKPYEAKQHNPFKEGKKSTGGCCLWSAFPDSEASGIKE